jgi:hypothetical protein
MNFPERRFGGRKQMNMTFQRNKITQRGSLTSIAVSALLILGSASSADAWHEGYSHTVGGAVTGGVAGGLLGAAIGGKKGILPGVIIGGAAGAAISSTPRPAAPPPRTYYPPTPVYNNGLVYNIQASLTNLGYNPGPIDGVYGSRTGDAISQYEYNNQLPVTGIPSQGVHYHMNMKQSG